MTKRILTLLVALTFALNLKAQVTIVNSSLQPFNVTPQSLCQANLLNSGNAVQSVTLKAELRNASGQIILSVVTQPFQVKPGLNPAQSIQIQLVSTSYGTGSQSEFVRIQKMLPAGYFKHCITIIQNNGEAFDDYCDDIESSQNPFLYLVFPYDKDTIDHAYPLLSWTHSEPFTLLNPGESFRMILVELNKEQTSETGLLVNIPLFTRNFLNSHEVQYPIDAPALLPGKRYGWQVQKIVAGSVIQKSEAWEFTVKKSPEDFSIKYAVAVKNPGSTFYTLHQNRLYFRFEEPYNNGTLDYKIYNNRREIQEAVVHNDNGKKTSLALKKAGDNRYELDLTQYQLPKGFYMLEIKNGVGEIFKIQFYVD